MEIPSVAGRLSPADSILRLKLLQKQICASDFARKQAAAALTAVWQSEDLQEIGELLRPFGLL
jgi:hypothetical protein